MNFKNNWAFSSNTYDGLITELFNVGLSAAIPDLHFFPVYKGFFYVQAT